MEQDNPNQNQLNINPTDQNFAKQNLGGQVKNMEEEKMKGGYFYYYLLVIVVVASVVWLFWKGGGGELSPKETERGTVGQEMPVENANLRTGILKASDNPARGNLMLVTENKDALYISTVRDFNSLVGKEVKVSTEGTGTGFKLLDITAK